MNKIAVVKWLEKRVSNEVIAVWIDKDGKEVDPKKARFEGSVYVRNNSALTSLTMPNEVGGYVDVDNNSALTSLTMPNEVGGYVYVRNNSALTSLTMPNEVGGYVDVDNNSALTSLTMPNEVGGYVDVDNNSALTSLTMPNEVGGYVYVRNNSALTSLTMPNEVGGYVDVRNNSALTSLTMPNEVGGSVDVDNNSALTSLTMPNEVGGYVDVRNNSALTSLTMPNEVGGSVDVDNNSALTSLTMPNEVGGYVYVRNNSALKNVPEVRKTNSQRLTENNHRESINNLITAILLTKNILFADGIMSHIIAVKNNVFKVRIYGKKEISYCVYRNGHFAHGKTSREAIDSLKYKISDRNTSEYEGWTLETQKPLLDMVHAYRKITGACEGGVRNFLSTVEVPKQLTIQEVINLSKNRYGNSAFERFFNK